MSIYDKLHRIILAQKTLGKYPDSIAISEHEMDELAQICSRTTSGWINDNPPGAPKDILFMGVKIETFEVLP